MNGQDQMSLLRYEKSQNYNNLWIKFGGYDEPAYELNRAKPLE